MIKKFIDCWDKRKAKVEDYFKNNHPDNYKHIVEKVISILYDDNDYSYEYPSIKRIHEINDGDYQGTLLYVIGSNDYQPSDYWFVKVDYGSCGGCDTLQAILDSVNYDDDKPTEDQVKQYMQLALHILQGLTSMQVKHG